MMKIFITQFTVGDITHSGPVIHAENFEQAEEEDTLFGGTVVGILESVILEDGEEEWKRVLH